MNMNRVHSLALLLSVVLINPAYADNRQADDQIFSDPATAGWTQIFLGITELVAAQYAFPGMAVEGTAVKAAELELTLANDLPVSEAQRTASIQAILKNPNNFDFESDIGDESLLKTEAATRIERLRSVSIIDQAEKAKIIAAASTNLAAARETALKAAQNLGLIDKSVKVLRVGASVLLVGDVAARLYIWNAMDANPTISPAATYLYDLIAE
jgi:hypothetical protein